MPEKPCNPCGVIEDRATNPTTWTYSFTDHNPEPDDAVNLASEEDAWKLDRHIKRIIGSNS